MKVYIAGKYTAKERLKIEAEKLRDQGFSVTSTWLEEEDDPSIQLKDVTFERQQDIATRDLMQIRDSDVLILDTLDDNPRGGREVEFGSALALRKVVIRVGPAVNVFHSIVDMAFKNWEDFRNTTRQPMNVEGA